MYIEYLSIVPSFVLFSIFYFSNSYCVYLRTFKMMLLHQGNEKVIIIIASRRSVYKVNLDFKFVLLTFPRAEEAVHLHAGARVGHAECGAGN